MLDGEDSGGVSGETVIVGEEEAGGDDPSSGGEGIIVAGSGVGESVDKRRAGTRGEGEKKGTSL